MRLLRIPISDRTLRRWLDHGRPKRVSRRLQHDTALEDRLRSLSDLDEAQLAAITLATAHPEDLIETTTNAVNRELADRGVLATIGDLLGLGVRAAEVLLTTRERDVTDGGERGESADS